MFAGSSVDRTMDRTGRGSLAHVGSALETVYQRTVREGVPDDIMDLLRRLT